MPKKPEVISNKFVFNNPSPKGYLNLLQFFRNNMVEVKFSRKGGKPVPSKAGHRFAHRRMVCTANWDFISKPIISSITNYQKPQLPAKGFQWYSKRNLIIVWDLLNLDWRIVHIKDLEIVAAVPLESLFDKARFLVFYQSTLSKLGPGRDPLGNKRNRIADK